VEGKPLALAVFFSGIFAIALGVLILHAASTPPLAPKRPEPPPPPSSMINSDMRFSVLYYKALIEQDAKSYGITAPAYDDLLEPNPYFEELHVRQRLRIKAPIETRHLRITLEVSRQTTTIESHSLSTDHLVLRIENRTPLYLAYRIQTTVPERGKCSMKASLPHNAVALEPEQTILRTECLYRKEAPVDITRIEVIELPALSAFYVSIRAPPPATRRRVERCARRPFRGGRSRRVSTGRRSAGATSWISMRVTTATSTRSSSPTGTVGIQPLPCLPGHSTRTCLFDTLRNVRHDQGRSHRSCR
jgi:hypothetical protein